MTSRFIGVSYNESVKRWHVKRWSKKEKKMVNNGYYKDEDTAAHASDNLARKLMQNGEQNHKLNFPENNTEVNPETKNTSSYIGVSYSQTQEKWQVSRRSNSEKKMVHNGTYKDEETAAHASDTLARTLMANGEHNHRLNFSDDDLEVYGKKALKNKRKRRDALDAYQTEHNVEKFE